MKQLEGAKRAEMLQDAANKGFDDVTVEILKSKTIFTQNLLLKGDTVEFEDFDIQLIKQGKEFKTVNKDGEEITVRGLMILAASTECGAGSRSAPFNAVAKSHLKVARNTWKPFARNTTSICAYSPAVMRWRSPNSSQANDSKSRRTSPLSSSGSTRTVRSLRESLTSNQSRYSRNWHNNWRVGSNPCSPSFFHQPKPPTGTKAPDKFVVHHKYKINVIVVHRSLI